MTDPLNPKRSGAGESSAEGIEALASELRRAVDRCCVGGLAQHRDDVFQMGFMRVMRAVEGGAALNAAYLKRVAFTAMVDELRRLRRAPASVEDIDKHAGPTPEGPEALRRAAGA